MDGVSQHRERRDPPLLVVRDRARGGIGIGRDQTVVLLGASGSGKSTWLRALVGLGPPFDDAKLLGKPLTRAMLATSVGWVPQGDGVFLSETVWGNVHASRYLDSCAADRAADALDWVGLADRAQEPVGNLGPAARRRVALARVVARRRPLLVIDGELDGSLWPLFPSLCEHLPWLQGVLVATATVDQTVHKADGVAPVEDGRVLAQAPLSVLMKSTDPGVKAVLAWTTP